MEPGQFIIPSGFLREEREALRAAWNSGDELMKLAALDRFNAKRKQMDEGPLKPMRERLRVALECGSDEDVANALDALNAARVELAECAAP